MARGLRPSVATTQSTRFSGLGARTQFTRDTDSTLRHFYTTHLWMAPDVKERDIDLLNPIGHFMDLTPQGRGNWYTSLYHGTKVQAAST
jgi:hypothetical protein